MGKRVLIIICATFFHWVAVAQSTQDDPVKNAIDYTINGADDGASDVDDLTAKFEELLATPIFINNTSSKNLEKILFLSDFQIESITDYVQQNGTIKTANELQYIPGFDIELANVLAPFVRFDNPPKTFITLADLKNIRQDFTARYTTTLQSAKGYSDTTNNRFKGDKNYYGAAYNLMLGKSIYVNLHGEKDAGEPSRLTDAGFDSFSGSIYASEPLKYISKIVVGDYRHNLGQGLLSWSGFATGKDVNPSTVRRRSSISPFKSYNEIYFYRGVAIESIIKPIKLTFSASHRKVDGHLSTTDSTGIVLYTTGLHRNESEISSKNEVDQDMVAGSLSYQIKSHTFSVNHFYKKNQLENLSSVEEGSSVDFYGKIKNFIYYGEVAIDNRKNVAQYYGTNIKMSSQTIFTASYRNYPKEFNSKSNASFGESSNSKNEEGVYLGVRITPKYQLTISGYVDMFKSKYPKYRVSKPSDGTEAGFSVSGFVTPKFEPRVRIRYKTKELDVTQPNGKYSLTERVNSYKFDALARYYPNSSLEITANGTVAKYTTISYPSKVGYLIYANLKYTFEKIPIRLYGRFSVFDAESWDVALYCYENDLPGYYSISSFYKRGSRAYFMANAKINRHLKLWFKIAQTTYAPPIETIGDGVDKINSNKRTDIRIQATIDF